jgi:hypothetical protein
MSYSPTTNIVGHTDILAQAIARILPMGGSDAYWDEILMMIEDETKVANVVREGEESTSVKKMWEVEESTSVKKMWEVEESTSVKKMWEVEESTSVKRVIDDEECTSASLDILKAVCDNLPPKESTSTKKVLEVEESTSAKKVTEDEECTSASLDILKAVSENEDMFGVEYIETLDEEDVKVLMMKIGKFLK